MQIADEEDHTVEMEDETQAEEESFSKWCLVGRLLTERPMDFAALEQVMASRPVKGMFVKELEVNRYMFQFFHELDVKRVEEGSPWTFNRAPIILERIKKRENLRTVPLNLTEIWVQVYDRRAGFMFLKACGDFIGKFMASCPKNYTAVGRE